MLLITCHPTYISSRRQSSRGWSFHPELTRSGVLRAGEILAGGKPSSASDIAAENRGVPNVAAPCVNLTLQRADGFERQPKAAAISNVRRQSQSTRLRGQLWKPTCTRMLISTTPGWEAGVKPLLLSSSNL